MSTSSPHDRWTVRTQDEAAELFGCSRRTIAGWLASGCPGEHGAYHLPTMLSWAKTNRWCRTSDPMLSADADSPALERYRAARAELAEIDVEARRETLLKRDAIEPIILGAMGVIRNCGERLQAAYGPEALAIQNEAIDAAIRMIEEGAFATN